MGFAVQTIGLKKTYRTKVKKGLFKSESKSVEALKGVNLTVSDGEVFGLLGPNGAGKTTMVKILTTLLLPDDGKASVNGYDVLKESNKVRASIGVMLMGERSLYWKLTGRENLEFFGSLYHIPRKVLKERIEWVVDLLGLEDYIDRLVETYSSGQKISLAFAKALINDAPILFLDEPTVALDPRRALEFRKVIKALNKDGKTIFLTTHIMQEADELCDRIAIIDGGRIVALDSPENLKLSVKKEGVLEVEAHNMSNEALRELRALGGVKSVGMAVKRSDSREISKLRILCDNPRDVLGETIDVLVKHNIQISFIKPSEPTLEDVFIKYTGRALEEADKNAK